jgi:dUTPase
MSIVHIKGRVTASEEKFDQASFSDQSFLLTDANQGAVENFSLELHVGVAWALTFSPQKNQLTTISEKGIKIPGRGSVVVVVKEKTKVPHNLYGIILPTGSLFLSHGILIAPAKIEPGFNGYLKLRLFNTTPQSHLLHIGDKLGSAIFFTTEITVRSNEITSLGQVAGLTEKWHHKAWRWISLNQVSAVGWLVSVIGWIVTIGITLVMYFSYYQPSLEAAKSKAMQNPQQYPITYGVKNNQLQPQK